MLVVLVEVSKFTVELRIIEKCICFLTVGSCISCMTQSIRDLVESQMQLIKFFGRLVVGERESSTGLALLDHFFKRLVQVNDLLSHPLSALLRINYLDDTDKHRKNQSSNRKLF